MRSGDPNPDISERTPLLSDGAEEQTPPSYVDDNRKHVSTVSSREVSQTVPTALIWAVLPTLLVGVFIAQADSSIVLATSQEIASEFGVLSDASWLITTYTLAQCACQPLYGKTSDILGRKPALAFAYVVFTLGCVICGIGSEYWHVLAGRTVSGIGGAGMVCLAAVIIADMLPPRQVASWRGYVNVVATLGRSCGGPTGGWLVDNIGWRWCFLVQCPIAAMAVLLILWRLPSSMKPDPKAEGNDPKLKDKIARIDFAGFLVIPATLVAFFVALDFMGKMYPWIYTASMGSAATALFAILIYVEKCVSPEPIIPLSLICKRDVWVPYCLIGLQTASQFIVTYTIPMYFQIAGGMSVTAAGSRIVVIVVGNAIGGLLTGSIVSRTGRYKSIIWVATILGNICYILVLARWHGSTGWLDTSYLFLGGLGMGSTQNTTFVHLAAALDAKDIAVAGTSWFLSQSVGMLVAVNIFNVVHNVTFINCLKSALQGVPEKQEIINGASGSVEYIFTLPADLRRLVTKSFVQSLVPTNALALAFGLMAMLLTLGIREKPLSNDGQETDNSCPVGE